MDCGNSITVEKGWGGIGDVECFVWYRRGYDGLRKVDCRVHKLLFIRSRTVKSFCHDYGAVLFNKPDNRGPSLRRLD